MSPPSRTESRLLGQVALALNSTLELWEVLRMLEGVTLEATGADRASIFLLQGSTLHPAAALAAAPDEDLWSAFKAMGPVDIDVIPTAWARLLEGRAVPITDAAASELIPAAWVQAFSLKSLVLVPLLAVGEPCGVMAVDYQDFRDFPEDELELFEAIASSAAVGVRNARMFEVTRRRSQLQAGLARASAALISPLRRDEILAHLVDSFTELFSAKLCAIGLVTGDHAQIDVVATRGVPGLEGPIEVPDVPPHIVESLKSRWGGNGALEVADDVWIAETIGGRAAGAASYILLPLRAETHLLGGVLLGLAAGVKLDEDERAAAEALAAIAAAALERGVLVDRLGRQLHHLEILHRLAETLAEHANANVLVARLNQLLADQGIEVAGITFRDRTLARRLGGADPLPEEKRAWRAGTSGCFELPGDTLGVPMRLGRRLVGTLRVRTTDTNGEDRSFLETLAQGVAEVASRGALRIEVEEAERERAVAAERGRIAADLHDTAGQQFVAIGLLARREAEHLPVDSPWKDRLARLAELADRGKWEIMRAIQALAFFPAARRGLVPSLKSLARVFEQDSGIEIFVEVSGSVTRQSPRIEQAFYRVAHEALANAWRHARCAVIRVELSYSAKEVSLSVTDDGVGVGALSADEGPRVGIANMRRAMDEVGGKLRIRAVKPRGTKVEARMHKEKP